MEWIAGEVRKSVNPRTYVLLGVLALALAWAVSEKGRPRHHAPTFGAAAALATTSAPLAEPTPAGWGRDPFDPRAVSQDVNGNGR
ncbi:MAG TPA: hypothetical protein VFF34_00390 [Candidatus Nitrosocosmicus sp.]|nr:hypothetical protein [Candidatus Nitrosocosmicus sp.]